MFYVRGRLLLYFIIICGSGIDSREPKLKYKNFKNKRFLKFVKFNSWGLLYLPGKVRQI